MNRLSWIIIIVLAIGLGLIAFLKLWGSHFIDQKLQTALNEAGLEVSYQKINLGLFERKISVEGLNGQYPIPKTGTVQGEVYTIALSGIQWWPLLMHSQLNARTLSVIGPEVRLYRDSTVSRQSGSRDSSNFKIELQQLELKQGKVSIYNRYDSSLQFSADTFNATLHQISLASGDSSLGPNIFKQLEYQLSCIRIPEKSGLHELQIEKLSGKTVDSTLMVEGLHLLPNYSRRGFSRQLKHKTGRMELDITAVQANGIHYGRLWSRQFQMRKLSIPFFSLHVFMDKNVPHDKSQYKKLPQHLLADFGFNTQVDSLEVKSSYIRYSELLPGRNQAGYVDFHKLKATFYNINNNPSDEKGAMRVETSCLLYGSSPVHVRFNFPNFSAPWTYYYRGSLRNFRLSHANQIIAHAAKMKFVDGRVNTLSFEAMANDHMAKGDIEFYYKDVDIEFIEKESGLFKEMVDGLVEWLAFPQENLPGEKHRIGQMYYERDTSRFIFHHLWHSVLSGIKSVILPNLVLPDELKHQKVKE